MTSTSTTLEGLSAGSSYQVRVRAVSDVGNGPFSEISEKVTSSCKYIIFSFCKYEVEENSALFFSCTVLYYTYIYDMLL